MGERVLQGLARAQPHPARRDGRRRHLKSLLRISHLGPVDPAHPDIASHVLTGLVEGLIDEEGAGVKDRRLRTLTSFALRFSILFGVAYVLLRVGTAFKFFGNFPAILWMDPIALANFCALWIGCFVGVVLSYGIRKTNITLVDLIRSDADRLLPDARLIFAGTLTMLLGIMLLLGIVEIKIGNVSTSDFAASPMVAFLTARYAALVNYRCPMRFSSGQQRCSNQAPVRKTSLWSGSPPSMAPSGDASRSWCGIQVPWAGTPD
jgi:hypothetical protein